MSEKINKEFQLIPLVDLDTELQMIVREIRNKPNIRKWMFTDHVIGVEEHLAWIRKLKQDDKQIVFAVLDHDDGPIGVVSVNAIDWRHKKADWAYYLTDKARGGLGAALEYSLINFVFDELGMEKLNCEVLEGNFAVVKLHKKFFFVEEGYRRSNVIKNGARVGVHLLGLTREDWEVGKLKIKEKYAEVFKKYPVTIKWDLNSKKVPPLCNDPPLISELA